jgi:hypothetical protein
MVPAQSNSGCNETVEAPRIRSAGASGNGAGSGADHPAGRRHSGGAVSLCLLAGLGDLRFILRGKLSPTQRLSRHLWRMCFAFFIATGSFFLGQQDVMPRAVRGSPILFVLAFAPFALMLFWLVRVRFSKVVSRLKLPGIRPDRPTEGPISTSTTLW